MNKYEVNLGIAVRAVQGLPPGLRYGMWKSDTHWRHTTGVGAAIQTVLDLHVSADPLKIIITVTNTERSLAEAVVLKANLGLTTAAAAHLEMLIQEDLSTYAAAPTVLTPKLKEAVKNYGGSRWE